MITPPYLRRGDKIGIVAPASKLEFSSLEASIATLENDWGLQVVIGESVRAAANIYAGEDALRAQDMQCMLDDPSIRMIIAARGGYGCSRIIDRLDFSNFLASPKWLVGFSDLTVFLSALTQLEVASIHGPMAKHIADSEGAVASQLLKDTLWGIPLQYTLPNHSLNRLGNASGQLVGGNLCVLTHLLHTNTEVNTEGKILFIEDIGEYNYAIDRMLVQWKRSGKLASLAGLVVGQFSDCKDGFAPYGKNAFEIIQEHTAAYEYPICFDFPAGHVTDNRPLLIGVNATLRVELTGTTLQFPSSKMII